MNCFRTSLLIAIVSLITLSGYAHALADKCCSEAAQEQAGCGTITQSDSCDCLCLCHSAQSPIEAGMQVHFSGPVLMAPPPAQQAPPEVLPVGIEYPPRLG